MLEQISETFFPKIEFLAGSEKLFAEFISDLNEEKIALISHIDLDGIACAKVVSAALQPDLTKFLDYPELNDSLILELKKSKIKTVIFTDLYIVDEGFIKSIERFARILIIDHHQIIKDWNSEKTTFINAQNQCAAFLCYYLFSKTMDLSKLDWIVACACIADWSYFNNQEWLTKIYNKYGDKFIADKDKIKHGKFWELQYEISLALVYWSTKNDIKEVFNQIRDNFQDIGSLREHGEVVQKEINRLLKKFEKEKESIPNGYFFVFQPKFRVKSILINEISSTKENYFKTLILLNPSKTHYSISSRRQDGKINLNELLKEATKDFEGANGGGHFKASGGKILRKDLNAFKEKLIELLNTKYKT